MKDLSLFLLKNSLGARMRRGIRTFCNGDDSTSTLNQVDHGPVFSSPTTGNKSTGKRLPTLEEMILQLEMEEEAARKEKLLLGGGGRMSCVNNSDILRSARNALNQYPRFSLDGKDAMYRSSFKTLDDKEARKSVCCERGLRKRFCRGDLTTELPPKVAGERVVWCKPGVVAKLMGLEAMPVPILGSNMNHYYSNNNIQRKEKLSTVMKRHQILWRKSELGGGRDAGGGMRRGRRSGSCSRTDTEFFVLNPVAVGMEPPELNRASRGGWSTRRFV